MKKAIAWILILTMALSLAACGSAPETKAPETTAAPTETQPAPTEAQPAPTQTEPVEVPTVTAKPLYGEILDSYFDCLLQGLDPIDYEQKGLNILPGMVKDVEKVGYCLEDLDGDGSTELLIGTVGEPYIYAMYTAKDGEETMVIDAGERNSYRLTSDGVFVNTASCSAAQSAYFLFTLAGGALTLRDGIVCDATVDSENPWFYVQDDRWDPATYQSLDTGSAEAIVNDLDAGIRPIAYIPFSEYNA